LPVTLTISFPPGNEMGRGFSPPKVLPRMSRFWLTLLSLAAAGSACAGPTTGLPPIPWPTPPENAMPDLGMPTRMVPLQPSGPPAPLTPAPLMYLRLVGPAGSHVTFYRGGTVAEHIPLPAVIGFRPGYQYRCELTGVPGRPGVTYYPNFEIRGSIALSHRLRGIDYPASVVFKEEDLEKLFAGTVIQRLIVLERPETALPRQSGPDTPLELLVPSTRDAFTEGRERGLPLAYFFLGQRAFEPAELVVPLGTVYLPGDKTLPPAAMPPFLPHACYPLIDPIAGPIHPSDFVSVFDGGDSGLPAGFDGRGKLRGVDPSDTVAEYITSQGVKKLAVSNRVALCIPRYILLRTDFVPNVRATTRTPEAALAQKTPVLVETQYELITRVQKLQLELARRTARPSITENVYGTTVMAAIKSARIRISLHTPETLNGAKMPGLTKEDGPLLICKWPDRPGANIGELVMFSLKYTNTGQLPMQNVVVIDNLTPRFEYVPGTAKTDRDGTFTFQPNDAGSHLLRWEINGDLAPGESGLITFQVRVR
jgi:uncharacterized repeat protein (TIGR01451 family)